MDNSTFLRGLTIKQLLQLNREITDELIDRDVCRTANNPISEYAEWLVAKALNLTLAERSNKGHDAVDPLTGDKYEIKARRLNTPKDSRQLSAIRNIDGEHFAYLIAVVFNSDCEVISALKVPWSVVKPGSKYRAHTNSHILFADARLENTPGVDNITNLISQAAKL